MFDILGIRAYFQRVAADRAAMKARDATFGEATAAIDVGDVTKVAEIASSTGFSYRQTFAMMLKAINTDNVEMFKAILNGKGFNGDVNEKMHYFSPLIPEMPHYYSEQSLLYAAVSNGRTNVAVWLAENPETDITQSGYHESSRYEGGRTRSYKTPYKAPLELARELELTPVVRALAMRTAELKQTEAAALMREANGFAPA